MTKEQNSKNLIEIPENATIGDVIKAVFPDWKIEHIRKMSGLDRYDINIDSFNRFSFYDDFWNSPYQPVKEAKELCKEIKTMAKEQDYMRGYKDGKSNELDEVRAEIEQIAYPSKTIYRILEIIDKHKAENKESATVAKFHDFYPEDHTTWPPADKEILVKRHTGENFIAYLELDDSEDGGWGFYNDEDGDFIADLDDISAWMPIPQHERDKNYIPVWEREKKTIPAETQEDTEEEKDR